MLDETYYFKMISETSGIVEKDVRVLYLRDDDKYCLKSLTSNF